MYRNANELSYSSIRLFRFKFLQRISSVLSIRGTERRFSRYIGRHHARLDLAGNKFSSSVSVRKTFDEFPAPDGRGYPHP